MKAVVMAGGQGTRLRPLTSNQPKPMVPIVNKPCLQHTLELLQRHGIDEVIITLAFLPRHIRSYFGDGGAFGVQIQYSVEEVPAGTAGSVLLAREALDDTFLVISGDAVTDLDLTDLVAFHKQRDALVTLALSSVSNPLEFGVVIVDEEGRVQRFLEKPGWGQVFSDTVNTGIYVLEPSVLDHVPPGEQYDFSRDLFPKLLEMQQRLYGRVCEGYWQDVGSLEQYLQANRDAMDGLVRLTPPGVRIRGNIWVAQDAEVQVLDEIQGPAVIGEGVRIERGAQVLGHTVLGDHTVLRQGCQVVGSVLGENVYVASGAVVAGAVLGNGVEVRENAGVAQGAVVGDRSKIGRGAVIGNNVKVYPFKSVEAGSEVRSSLVWETRGPSTLFGRSGVRGLANVDLTPEMATRLGIAYGTMLRKGDVVTVSRDAYEASRVMQRAMVAGLNSTGISVRDLAIATSALNHCDLATGDSVGAIHIQMSADSLEAMEILFAEPPGVPLDQRRERAIENHYFREDFRRAPVSEVGTVLYPPGLWDAYMAILLAGLDTASISSRKPCLVLDFATPASAPLFASFFEAMGAEIITVGTPPNDAEGLRQLPRMMSSSRRVGEVVLAKQADIGAVFDSSAERLCLVDDKGRAVSDAELLLILLEAVATEAGKGSVAVPLQVTRWAERVAGPTGVSVRRTKCSRSVVLAESIRAGSLFAADGEGGYAFPLVSPAMDSLYALGVVLQLIAKRRTSLSALAARAPRSHVAHVLVDCPWGLKAAVMRRLTLRLSEGRVSLIDGIKVFLPNDDWALVLPDIDEALFHVYAETADDASSNLLAGTYRDLIATAIAEAGGM